MSGAQKRIEQMLLDGQVTEAEAEVLRSSIREGKTKQWLRRLSDPFANMGVAASLVAGIVGVLASYGVFLAGARLDGLLDVHLSSARHVGVWVTDVIGSWGLASLVFWGAARMRSKDVRWIDFVASIGVSRLPLVVCGALMSAVVSDPDALMASVMAGEVDLVVVLVMLTAPLFLGVTLLWMYFGFRTASGLKGKALVSTAIVAIVGGELVSKLWNALMGGEFFY